MAKKKALMTREQIMDEDAQLANTPDPQLDAAFSDDAAEELTADSMGFGGAFGSPAEPTVSLDQIVDEYYAPTPTEEPKRTRKPRAVFDDPVSRAGRAATQIRNIRAAALKRASYLEQTMREAWEEARVAEQTLVDGLDEKVQSVLRVGGLIP